MVNTSNLEIKTYFLEKFKKFKGLHKSMFLRVYAYPIVDRAGSTIRRNENILN